MALDIFAAGNFLATNNFKLEIPFANTFNEHVQAINLPGANMNPVTGGLPTPFTQLQIPGHTMYFDTLTVTAHVDENMMSYQEIASWMFAVGFPSDFSQYATISNIPSTTGGSVVRDITLTILNSQEIPFIRFTYIAAYPILIGPMQFDSRPDDVQYAVFDVQFKYQSFKFQQIVNGVLIQNNVTTTSV